jgi:type III pantothenate kinase
MKRLAIDVGNTRTSAGIFEDGILKSQWRISTAHWTADDLWVILKTLLDTDGCGLPDAVAYASVVPQVHHSINNLAVRYMGIEPLEVTYETAGIRIEYRYPHELGSDRLANAAGAMKLGSLPAIVVDFGTATTFDVISSSGAYLGGAIAPGVGTAAAELFKKAERLNPVDLEFPSEALAQSTSEAICSGVLLGAVGAADFIIDSLKTEMEDDPVIWATGGWARGIAEKCSNNLRVSPELTLVGIDSIGERFIHGE